MHAFVIEIVWLWDTACAYLTACARPFEVAEQRSHPGQPSPHSLQQIRRVSYDFYCTIVMERLPVWR